MEEEVAAGMFDGITATTLEPVLDGIKELFPIVVPVVISCLALRKGWSFLKSQIRGA